MIWISTTKWQSPIRLNDCVVPAISSLLEAGTSYGDPVRLQSNEGKAYLGAKIGDRFLVDNATAIALNEAGGSPVATRQLVTGMSINSSLSHLSDMWVVDLDRLKEGDVEAVGAVGDGLDRVPVLLHVESDGPVGRVPDF